MSMVVMNQLPTIGNADQLRLKTLIGPLIVFIVKSVFVFVRCLTFFRGDYSSRQADLLRLLLSLVFANCQTDNDD